jgi:hypothetical protein
MVMILTYLSEWLVDTAETPASTPIEPAPVELELTRVSLSSPPQVQRRRRRRQLR